VCSLIERLRLGLLETHALKHFEKVDRLEEIMTQFGITLDLSTYTASENEDHYLPGLGGIFALLRKGYDISDKEFKERFIKNGRDIMGPSLTIPFVKAYLDIMKNLNLQKYFEAIRTLDISPKPSS